MSETPKGQFSLTAGKGSPAQQAAWRQLWTVLLAPPTQEEMKQEEKQTRENPAESD